MNWYACYDLAQAAYDRSPTEENAAHLREAERRMYRLKAEHDYAARLESDLAHAMLASRK